MSVSLIFLFSIDELRRYAVGFESNLTSTAFLQERKYHLSKSSWASVSWNSHTQYQNLMTCNHSMDYSPHTFRQVQVSTYFSLLKVSASGQRQNFFACCCFLHELLHFYFLRPGKCKIFIDIEHQINYQHKFQNQVKIPLHLTVK